MRLPTSLSSIFLGCLLSATAIASPFSLSPLPYDTGALEPAIDKATMELHYGKHHKSYVDKLNEAVESIPELKNKTLEDLLANASKNAAIRNNAGGHWNHTFFWESMAPTNRKGQMSSDFKNALEKEFGSADVFKTRFRLAGLNHFGSGWVWLLVDKDGKLVISSTPNQDNPLMDLSEIKGTPLLGNDLWEHAYYLQYNNRRADYLDAWWQVVDWAVVSKRYADAKRK
jgi:Fe-Mn family superoxide dismutase